MLAVAHFSFLTVLAVVLATAVGVSILLHRAQQSTLVGYFLCGMLLGPHALGLISDGEGIRLMSEVGIILLMFTIGIEFSLGQLLSLTRIASVGAPIQIGGTILLGVIVALACGLSLNAALLVGVVLSLSSTAIVLKLFQEGTPNASLANRAALGIALVQDIFAIAFMILLPLLVGAGPGGPFWKLGLKGLGQLTGFAVICWLLSRYVIPWLLRKVNQTGSRELFTLTVLGLCAGIAVLSLQFGLSYALGAFIAGLLVSETVYSHKIMADIVPFKDFFLTLFFISVGMLIDIEYLLSHLPLILTAVAAILIVKTVIALGAGLASSVPLMPSTMAALGLAGVGEFSLVMLNAGSAKEVLSDNAHQFLLVCTAATMALVPIVAKFAVPLGNLLHRLPLFSHPSLPPEATLSRRIKGLEDHAIICGYGPVGLQLNQSLRQQGIQTLVIELNAKTIEDLYKAKQPCLFGDAAQPEAMDLARIKNARLLAITFPLFEQASKIAKLAFVMNPHIIVVARARFPNEVEQFRLMGVQEVVYEEMASGLDTIRRALALYEVEGTEIDARIQRVKYEMES